MKKLSVLLLSFFNLLILTGCSDMLETDSEMVEYEKDHTLSHSSDSVYSTMGIISKLQTIADRMVLLGEVRGDLMELTDNASEDLKNMSAFDFTKENKYNNLRDYYAVINNCNYFLAHADSAMQRRQNKLFFKEYVAVMTFRAWTYMQMGMIYGEVPFVVTPIMTEEEAAQAMQATPTSFEDICKYFIKELTPVADTKLPQFGDVNSLDSRQFFIPTRALLGDMCLWIGDYTNAAKWYHDYITDIDNPIKLSADVRCKWNDASKYEITNVIDAYSVTSLNEVISYIPMENTVFDGVISDLQNIYNSTDKNYYYFSVKPSSSMYQLSAAQAYSIEDWSAGSTKPDTVYAPTSGLNEPLLLGDLRLYSNYSSNTYGTNNEFSEYNTTTQRINKIVSSRITTYRKTMIYLRYAEALNRAGFPQSAVLILKRGICDANLKKYVDQAEVDRAGDLVKFSNSLFPAVDATSNDVLIRGIHSRGSGDVDVNAHYDVPLPPATATTLQDTLDYQIPLVEDMIIDEMALEGAFEGYRFYDLMRVALRRNDPAYLADKVAGRSGTIDAALRSKLMNTDNWFLPLP